MFLIIWGFRTKAKNLAMVQLACGNGHVAAHRIVSVTRWFTLFFIPLFPVRKLHYSVCAACGTQLKLPKDAAQEILAKVAAPGPAAPASPAIEPVHPPVAPAAPPAGWYPDPAGVADQRYWDGRQWTESVQQSPTAG